MVQLSHPYMTTEKNIALTIWTFVNKVLSLFFNMLSRFVIDFLPRSKHLSISWLQAPSAVILEPKNKVSVSIFPHQIPYDYTVEVGNRFNGLDLIDTVPDEVWAEFCDTVQETQSKTIPKKKKCKKAKWLSEESSQIAEKKRSKRQRRKRQIYPSETEVISANK